MIMRKNGNKEAKELTVSNSKNNFYKSIYELVAQIPPGKVMTYGQIAAWCGKPRGARAVGWAMRSAPIQLNLPCHRVVNRSGATSPDCVFGGAQIQRVILEREGITFKPDGLIDLKRHLWMVTNYKEIKPRGQGSSPGSPQ
jgi:methylated-DNA-protein-cysteine methyltransferase-like protein